MSKKRTFISFDYDNDSDLKTLLVGQARNEDSPFEITDMSIKEAIDNDWKAKARTRIKACDVVAVICGKYTDEATGVSAEISIAQEEGIPYFLLNGRANEISKKPQPAKTSHKIYNCTWNNLKVLINPRR